MEELTLAQLVTTLGPGGSVIALIAWMFIREKKNGKNPNKTVLDDILGELRDMNNHQEARDQRMEDIWGAVKKE